MHTSIHDPLLTLLVAGALLVAAFGAAVQLPWAREDLAATRRAFLLMGRWLVRRREASLAQDPQGFAAGSRAAA